MAHSAQLTSGRQRHYSPPHQQLATAVSRLSHALGESAWLRYVIAIIAIGFATALRWWLGALVGQKLPPFITFYPLVMFSALFGGMGPGLLATATASLSVAYFFLPPTGQFVVTHPADQTAIILFTVINVAVSLVCGALRAARHRTFAEARRAEASEERFRLFMNHTPALVWVKDDQGHYTYINKAYEQRFSHSLAECQGKTDADLWPPEVAARLQQADRAALAAGKHTQTIEQVTEPDGTLSFWLNTKFPLRDAAGRRFIASIGLDITDRKHAEDALRHREAILRKVLAVETVGTLFFTMDGRIIDPNDAVLRMSGYTREELSRCDWHLLTPPEFQKITQISAQRIAATGQTPPYEKQWIRKDGSRFWGLFAPIRIEGEGPNSKCMEFVIDITDRKQYEDSLRRSQASLAQALRVARLGTFEHDHLSDSITFSPKLRDLYHFAPGEPITIASVLQRVPTTHHDQFVRAIHEAHDPAGEGLFETEHPVIGPDKTYWVSVRSQTFFEGQGPGRHPVRTVGAILDITDQKEHASSLAQLVHDRTAQLEALVAELEHFSYTITHDMRAPLRAMTGYAGILNTNLAQSLSDEGRDLLRRISESALRMDQLITDALQYNRALRDRPQLESLDPAASICGIIRSYPQFQPPRARITVQPDMPHVLANQAALTQILSNLLGNAVKFVTPGQVPQITVTAEIVRSTEWVRLTVADNGIGIAPEYHDKIWHMFQRLNTNYEGTGIGLALVRKVVERMGGKVGLESTPGQGSRFWVELQKAS